MTLTFFVLADNSSVGFQPQAYVTTLCNAKNLYLRWFTDAFCATGKVNQLWTSGTRVIYTYTVTENGNLYNC